MKGYNDDAVISAAIGCWIKDTFISPGQAAASMSQRLIEGIKVEGHQNTAVQGLSKDPNFVKQQTMGVFITMGSTPPFQMRVPYAGSVRNLDLKWLIK
jgi:hypothetical protein